MDYQVSARKWRPQTFGEVVAQRHITTSLTNAIRLDKISQAYLFSGIRGVGKTSLARILSKAVNCKKEKTETALEGIPCNQCDSCKEINDGRSMDVIEIDGASNTGVDDVRELRENVKYLPLRGRFKIYIVDEVHMLSNAAFNALLKTLEEPPPHLIFILATTEAHKIPGTILSRCQHYTFRRMTRTEIVTRLSHIAKEEDVQLTERGFLLIARVAEGSMRDALTLFDQAVAFGGKEVKDEDLFTLLGRMDETSFHRLVQAVHQKNANAALVISGEIADQGHDLRQFLADWLEHLRHLIVTQNVEGAEQWIDLPAEEIEAIQSEAKCFSKEELQRLFALFARLQGEIRNAPQPHLLFEVALMKAVLLCDLKPVESMIERLDTLSRTGRTSSDGSAGGAVQKSHRQPLTTEPNMVSPPLQKKNFLQKNAAPLPVDKRKNWGQLLEKIKNERPNVGSYLEQGAVEQITETEVRLSFSEQTSFLIPLIQKESHQQWLETMIKDYFQREIRLVLLEHLSDAPTEKNSVEVSSGKNQVLSPPSLATGEEKAADPVDHPLVQEALKVMGGKVIDTVRRSKNPS